MQPTLGLRTGEVRRQEDVTMKWMVLLFLVTAVIAAAESTPEFHLCLSYVEKSALGEPTDRGWPVSIQLTESGAIRFETFTQANVGSVIRIVIGDREFSRAGIVAPIDSGRLQGTFSSQAAAIAWQRMLAGELPVTPCGAGSAEMPIGHQGRIAESRRNEP